MFCLPNRRSVRGQSLPIARWSAAERADLAMSRASLTAAAFAIVGGQPADARWFVHVDTYPDRSGRRLLVAVEPMESSPYGFELAGLALSAIREEFVAATTLPAPAALIRALGAANRTLLAESRPPVGGRWERRALVGTTAIAICGREATIAQVPPAQALVVQDRQRYAFPDLASWRPDYVPENDDPEPDPLGFREGGRPLLYRTLMAPGDSMLLCSSNLGRALANLPSADAEIGDDLDATLDRIGTLVADGALDDAFAAAIRVDAAKPSPRRRSRPIRQAAVRPSAAPPLSPVDAPPPQRPSVLANPAGPGARGGGMPRADAANHRERRHDRNGAFPGGHRLSLSAPGGIGAAARAPLAPEPIGVLRLALVGLVESVRPVRPVMRRSVVPGADSVCRYRERRAVPLGLWAGLPRGVTALLRSRLVFAFLAGSVAFGAATLVTEARRHESWRVTSALVALDTAVASAAADPLAAASRIIEADRALAAVPMEDLASGEWVERGAALEAARDQAWSIERLDGPTRVGLLPAPLRGTDASLVVLADRVYLASVGFYEIDLGTGRLVELLAPGQPVAGGEVGSIVDGVSDGLGVALSDGRSIYRQGSDGRWGALPLNSDGSGERPAPGRSAGFNGHLYALTGDGRVVRYEERGTELAPAQWAGPEEYPDLASARDIVVNGRVHLMLADGRVLAMNQGVLEAANIVPVTPPFSGDGFLGDAPGSRAVYLVEPGFQAGAVAGRVVRFDAGGATQQFVAPAPSPGDRPAEAAAIALGRARAAAVVEASNTLVFLSGDEVWRATLPPLLGR
jgi:hypothetical protein